MFAIYLASEIGTLLSLQPSHAKSSTSSITASTTSFIQKAIHSFESERALTLAISETDEVRQILSVCKCDLVHRNL